MIIKYENVTIMKNTESGLQMFALKTFIKLWFYLFQWKHLQGSLYASETLSIMQ